MEERGWVRAPHRLKDEQERSWNLSWASVDGAGSDTEDETEAETPARDSGDRKPDSLGLEVLLWALCGLAFSLGLAYYLGSQASHLQGRLTVMPSADALAASLGDWRVEWHPGSSSRAAKRSPGQLPQRRHAQLCVTWAFAPPDAEPAWTSPPGGAFITAIATAWVVSDTHGHIDVASQRIGMCAMQVVETVQVFGAGADEKFVMRGRLTGCSVGYSPPRFELTLAPPDGARGAADARPEVAAETTPVASTLALKVVLCAPPRLGGAWCEPLENGVFQLGLMAANSVHERIYGLGAQFSTVNLKGARVPVLSNEQGIGRGVMPLWLLTWLRFGSRSVAGTKHSTYTAMPTYLSSKGRGLYIDDTEYSSFDFRSPVMSVVEHNASSLHAHIVAGRGATPVLAMLEALTARAGRFVRLPEWAAAGGAVVGLQGGSSVVRAKVKKLRAADVPIIAVWLQDWVGKRDIGLTSRLWWNWEVDRTSYPDWEVLVAELAAQGIRVMGYVNPHLTDVSLKPAHHRNLFLEAREAGFLVRHCDGGEAQLGSFGLEAGMVDLSNPQAYAWMKEVVRGMLRAGVSGWMADFGEALPLDACMHDGTTGATWHNKYPAAWAALNREVIVEAEKSPDAIEAAAARDAWIFTRAAALGSLPHLNMQWLGDQLTSWDAYDGLASVLPATLSSGLSGLSLVHSDIGGYTSVVQGDVVLHRRTEELFARWCELAAFSPVYRSHEGMQPAANVQFDHDADTLDAFRRFAIVHRALAPYRRTLLEQAYSAGAPVMRHMLMHFPHDQMAGVLTTQYMLGPELLVTPVVRRGHSAVVVWLPLGTWVRLRLGRDTPVALYGPHRAVIASTGARYKVNAPLGHPAVYYRAGSEAAMQLQAALDDQLPLYYKEPQCTCA